jgi:DNA-binding CsgD family transcriptional regulator
MQGKLDQARAAVATLDDIFVEGFDAWARAKARAQVNRAAGNFDAVLAALDPEEVGVTAPTFGEFVIEFANLRADALAWKGDLERARQAVDEGEAAVARAVETYWHGGLAMVAMRIEADAAISATAAESLEAIAHAHARAEMILAAWNAAVHRLHTPHPLIGAYSLAIDAERARMTGDDVSTRARAAADAFAGISMTYYETYWRMREADATLDEGAVGEGTDLLGHARGVARACGFNGIDAAITALARTHQLRLGPGRTTVDGDVPLSARELEVIRLMVAGKSNPEIGEVLYIGRRTAATHVSNILRKLEVSSRAEAVSEAHRRGLV